VFLASALVLGWNAAPGITFHDSGEFALAAKVGGIPHPPGAPTWTIAAWAATSLFGFLDAAYVTNLLNSVYGAAVLGLTTWLCQTWLRESFDDLPHSVCSLVAPLVLLASPAFLEQSFVTEQYMQLLMLNLLILVVGTKASLRGAAGAKDWLILGLLFGLCMGNHISQIVIGPVLLGIAWGAVGSKGLLKSFGWGLLGTLAGLSVFLYNPIRAATNPIMNWGQPDTWERFLWGIKREQWETRPFSDTPPGFVGEWFASYSLPDQIGWIAILLGIVGFVIMVRRSPKLLLWSTLAVVPYAAILLLGHMRQMGMDAIYIRHYGVVDWHIPIYALFGIGAAFGVAQLSDAFQSNARDFLSWVAAAVLGGLAFIAVGRESMRGDSTALNHVDNFLKTVPKNGLLFLAGDNTSHPAAYVQWAMRRRPDVFFGYGYPQSIGVVEGVFRWGPRRKAQWLDQGMHNWTRQPLDLPKLASADHQRPMFVEYPPGMPAAAAFMLPAGWVWQMKDEPVSNEEVLAADAWVKASHPDLFRLPSPNDPKNRLNFGATAQAHQRRGNYFIARRLYGSAIESYNLALAWEPDNAQLWTGAGFGYLEAGQYEDALKAYAKAIDILPTYQGSHGSMALAAKALGHWDLAEELMLREMELSPKDPGAAFNLKKLREDRAKAGR
jgi:hypothetical protein